VELYHYFSYLNNSLNQEKSLVSLVLEAVCVLRELATTTGVVARTLGALVLFIGKDFGATFCVVEALNGNEDVPIVVVATVEVETS